MKQILTFLIAVSTFVTVQAQSREETRRVILGDRKDNRSAENRTDRDPVFSRNDDGRYSNEKQYQVDQINREYNDKIASIRDNRYLNNEEKNRAIRQLEQDRQRRIAELNRQNNDRGREYNDNRYAKNNNGKHKGWYKKRKNDNWQNGKNGKRNRR